MYNFLYRTGILKSFWSRRGPDSRYSKSEILKQVKNMGMQNKSTKQIICLYMTSQHLRKVSVGQKPHKHDFPKLEISKNRMFGEIEICQENRNLAGSGGGPGGGSRPPR